MWQFNFFGGLRASSDKRVVERFRTQKTAALLALLALRGGRSREDVCALLWPDAAPEASRNSLSAALSSLRRDLGDDIVRADRNSVSLAPSLFQTDVALFNDAFKAGDLSRAVEIYRGHLLPGFHDDPFPALEREYEEKARAAFKTRLEELEENGHSTELLDLTRRAITLFGDDERWFLALMRGHYGLGDLDAALRAYDSLGRFMRKNGDTASESARVLAKLIRREKEREAIAPTTATFARRSIETPPSLAFSSSAPVAPLSPSFEDDDNWEDDAQTTRNNLPAQWTRFFGREDERSLLRTWLRDGQKMVTLSGAGGSGKTRLALETLRELASEWDGDMVYVPLAPLSDPDLILPAIRDALQLSGTPDLSPLEQIERTVRGRRALLFLDNFEQLVEGGAARLQALRERLPQTMFLVTSRILLQLPGEREFPVAPLPTPLRNTAPAQVRECASVALFCDRSGLVIDTSNAEAVGALCRRLDGIPLALELAAARAKVLAPAQILERLQKHPDFLQSRELGVPARHKTLRATIEWSTDLLPPDLREFWKRLSLFHGGWTLDAAEKIAAPGICEDWETLDWLTLLRECSLIFTEESGDSSRFRMLQTLREFGREQLQHSAEVEHAFFDFYLGLAQQAASAMQGPGQTAWLSRLDAEQDNLRAALTYAREAEPERGLLLATALIDFWETRLSLDEGRGWIETFLKATANRIEKPTPALSPAATRNVPRVPVEPINAPSPTQDSITTARVRALSGAGRLASHSIDLVESRALVEQGLEAARDSGDASNLIYAISSFVRFAMTSGDVETDMRKGRALADEAVQLARDAADKTLLLEALTAYNYMRISLVELEGLRVFFREAIAMARELKDESVLSRQLSCLAHLCYHEKKWDEANALLDESTSIARRLTSTWELLEALWTRSNVARESGKLSVARAAIAEEWEICRDNPMLLWARTMNMTMIAYLRICEGDPASAVRVFGSEEVARKQSGSHMAPIVRIDYDHYRGEALRTLGQDRFDALWEEGRSLAPLSATDAALYGVAPSDMAALTAARARALSGAGRLAFYASDLTGAENLLRQGLAEARRSGDSSVLIDATRSSALATTAFGDAARARDLGRESVRLARESGDKELLLKSLLDWGFAEVNVSDFLAAEMVCLEAIVLARREGKDRSLAIGLSTLAIAYNYLHRYEEAHVLVTESREVARREGATLELIVSSALLGHIASVQGQHQESRAAYREAISLTRDLFANTWTSVNVLISVAYSFFRRGDARGCTLIMGASESLAQAIDYELMPFLIPDYQHFRSQSHLALGEAEWMSVWNEGRALSTGQIIDFILEDKGEEFSSTDASTLSTRSLALSGAGRLAWYDGDFEASRALATQSLDAARQSGDTASFVHAVAAFVRLSSVSGDIDGDIERGRILSEEAVRRSRMAKDESLIAESLISLTYANMIAGRLTGVESLLDEAAFLARKLGDELQLATALVSRATLDYHEGRYAKARQILLESTTISRRLNSPFALFASLWCESHAAREEGDFSAAQRALVEVLELCRDNSALHWNVFNVVLSAGFLLVRRGDISGGVEVMSAADTLSQRVGYKLVPLLLRDFDRYLLESRQSLDETAFANAWESGKKQTLFGVIGYSIERLSRPTPSASQLAVRARALSGAGRLAWYASDMQQASALLEQGLNDSRESGDTEGIVYATRGLTDAAAATGDSSKSRHVAREALELARASGDSALLIKALLDQAFADVNIGELNSASSLASEAIALSRQVGDETALSLALNIAAIALSYQNRESAALPLISQSEEVARRIGSAWDLLVVLSLKGNALSRLEQHRVAQEAFNECLSLCRESFSDSWTVANSLLATAYSFLRRGEVRDGVQILGAAEAMRKRIGHELMPLMVPNHEQFVADARQILGEADFASILQKGASMSPDEIFDFAIRPLSPAIVQQTASASADEFVAARARALSGAGRLAWHDSDLGASRTLVEEGLNAARQSGDLASFVYAVAAHVRFSMVTHENEGLIAQSRHLCEEAVLRSRRAGDKPLLLDSLISLGYATCVLQQMPQAAAANEEAIALARELGDDASLVRALTTQAGVYYNLNTPSPALVLLEECIDIARRLNSSWDIIAALWLLSGVLRQQGRLADSYMALTEVFEICRSNPNYRWNVAHVLMMASYLFIEGGKASCAVRLMAASESLSEAVGYHPTPNLLPEYERYKAKAHEQLGESAFHESWEQGRGLAPEAAMRLALAQGSQFLSANTSSETIDEALAARARALSGAGRLASQGSDTESSRTLVNQALDAARQSGDVASFVSAVSAYVRFSMMTGDSQGVITQSRLLSAEAVARARCQNDKALLLDSLISFAYATCMLSRFPESLAASEEAVRLARELGDDTNLVRALNNQVNVYYHQGIYLPARIILEETESLSRRLNSPAEIISSLWGLSSVAREQNELDVAEAAMIEILELCRANPSFRWGISNILVSASYLFLKRDEPADAVRLMAAANALDNSLGYRTIPVLLVDFERYKAQSLELLGQSLFEEAWQQGGDLSTDTAIALALRLKNPPATLNSETGTPESTASQTVSEALLVARSRALSGAGRLAWHNNDLESSGRLVQEGLDAARAAGDLASFVYAVAAYVRFAMVTGDITGLIAQSRLLSEEAVARSRQVGDKALLLDSLISLGYSTSIVSQFRESYIANEEAIALARELGDETSLVRVLNNQGTVYYCQGMYAPARMALEESEQICRRLNSTWDLIAARWTLSSVAREQGDLELADESISEVLHIYRANPSILWGGTNVLLTASYLFVRRDDARTAVRLMSAAESILETLGYHLVPVLATDYERYRTEARHMLTKPDFASAWEEGHLLTPEAAIDLALQR